MIDGLLNNIKDLLNKIKLDRLDKLNLDKLKLNKNKVILIVGGVILILYLDFAFIMKMQWRYIKNVSPKIVKLKNDINTLTKDLVRVKDLQSRQAGMKRELAPRVKKIILQEQIPLLLQFISDAANKNNISIMQIRPAKDSKATQDASLKLNPVLITLVLSCDYHRLGQFISDLENAEDFIAVEEVRIVPGPVSQLNQNVNLLLRTYVKK